MFDDLLRRILLQDPRRQVETRIITHRGYDSRHFVHRLRDRLAIFRRQDFRKLGLTHFNRISQPVQQRAAVPHGRLRPPRKGRFGRGDGLFELRAVCPGRHGNHFLRRRVDHIQRHRAGHQFPIDQKLVVAHLSILQFAAGTARNHSGRARLPSRISSF